MAVERVVRRGGYPGWSPIMKMILPASSGCLSMTRFHIDLPVDNGWKI
jgi:hypothetical protein